MSRLPPTVLLLCLLAVMAATAWAAEPVPPKIPPQAPPAPTAWTDPATAMEFVAVAGGCFTMGCTFPQDQDCLVAEAPARKVCVDGFQLGRFEVTQGQWQQLMGGPGKPGEANTPKANVTRAEIGEFLRRMTEKAGGKASYRLPSEAEWEYACRGGRNDYFAGTGSRKQLDAYAWSDRNAARTPHPVGLLQANAFGLHDMSGNVGEMVQDAYLTDAYRRLGGTNPVAEGPGPYFTWRGGTYLRLERDMRCARRDNMDEKRAYPFLGFRVLRALPGQ